MSRQVEELIQVLLKNQATFGTAESSLVAADVAEVEAGAVISIDPRVKDISLVGAGFTQNQSIIGPRECGITMNYPFRTEGSESGSAGQVGKALKSCGMLETATDTDTDTTDDRFVYAPTSTQSEYTDSTIWGHSGNLDSSSSMIYKVQNVMFNGKIVLDFDNAYASLQLDGKGLLTSVPALGTQASVTPSAVATPALINATVDIFSDADYIPVNIEIDLGQDIVVTLDPTVEPGLGIALITKRKMTWTAKVYHDSGVNPYTPLFAGTTGTISVAWGTEPNKFTVSTTKAQIRSAPFSDQDGITTYDLTGILVDNDLSVQIDTAEA